MPRIISFVRAIISVRIPRMSISSKRNPRSWELDNNEPQATGATDNRGDIAYHGAGTPDLPSSTHTSATLCSIRLSVSRAGAVGAGHTVMSIEDLIKHPVSLHIAGVLAVPAVGCFGPTAAAPARPSAVATGSVDCLGCTNVHRASSLADPLSSQYGMHAPYSAEHALRHSRRISEEAHRCNINVTMNQQIAPSL
jgi:hypothetical protein